MVDDLVDVAVYRFYPSANIAAQQLLEYCLQPRDDLVVRDRVALMLVMVRPVEQRQEAHGGDILRRTEPDDVANGIQIGPRQHGETAEVDPVGAQAVEVVQDLRDRISAAPGDAQSAEQVDRDPYAVEPLLQETNPFVVQDREIRLDHIPDREGTTREDPSLRCERPPVVVGREQQRLAPVPAELDEGRLLVLPVPLGDVDVGLFQSLERHSLPVAQFRVLVTVPTPQVAVLARLDDELDSSSLTHPDHVRCFIETRWRDCVPSRVAHGRQLGGARMGLRRMTCVSRGQLFEVRNGPSVTAYARPEGRVQGSRAQGRREESADLPRVRIDEGRQVFLRERVPLLLGYLDHDVGGRLREGIVQRPLELPVLVHIGEELSHGVRRHELPPSPRSGVRRPYHGA